MCKFNKKTSSLHCFCPCLCKGGDLDESSDIDIPSSNYSSSPDSAASERHDKEKNNCNNKSEIFQVKAMSVSLSVRTDNPLSTSVNSKNVNFSSAAEEGSPKKHVSFSETNAVCEFEVEVEQLKSFAAYKDKVKNLKSKESSDDSELLKNEENKSFVGLDLDNQNNGDSGIRLKRPLKNISSTTFDTKLGPDLYLPDDPCNPDYSELKPSI